MKIAKSAKHAGWVASLAVLVVGCGSGAGGRPGYLGPDAGDFSPDASATERQRRDALDEKTVDGWSGTWRYVDGGAALSCSGSVAVTASEGLVVIAPAGDVLSVQQSGCAFTFTVDGDTATMEPDQVCAAWAIQIPMWSLTLQPDGSLQETLGGRIWLDGGPCTVSGKSTLTRG